MPSVETLGLAPVAFDLGLEATTGDVAWVSSNVIGGVAPLYYRHDRADRYVLKTLRFQLPVRRGFWNRTSLRCEHPVAGHRQPIAKRSPKRGSSPVRLNSRNLLGSRNVENFPDLGREILRRVGLADEVDPTIQNTVMYDDVGGVP